MKELDDFTVERLKEIETRARVSIALLKGDEVAALARIALAAKTAEPVAYADPQAFKNFQNEVATKEWMWANPGARLISMYAAPVLNSPELPDGWKLVPVVPTPEIEQAISDGIYNDLYTAGIYADLLAAAPTPPTTEK